MPSFFLRAIALVLISLIVPPTAFAASPVALHNFQGTVDFTAEEPVAPFTFSGTASHLGRFTAYGEAEFGPGGREGLLVGHGVAVFEAANGDVLVGVATLEVDIPANALRAEFPWRDSVEFGDGTIVPSTGRFARKPRPPGLAITGQWGSCFLLVDGIYVPGTLILGSLCCVETPSTQVCKQYPQAALSLRGTGTFTRR